MKTYAAFYKGKRIEIEAETQFKAQTKAAEVFKAKKSWQVNVAVMKIGNKEVTHTAVD